MSRAVDTANLLPETGRASITDYRGLPRKHKKHTRRVRNHQSDRQHDDLKRKRSRGRRKHGGRR